MDGAELILHVDRPSLFVVVKQRLDAGPVGVGGVVGLEDDVEPIRHCCAAAWTHQHDK